MKALTGVDTDRLPEEKRRGITLELGFAQLALPDGRTLGVIADIVGRKLARGEKERIIREKAYLPVGDPVLHPDPYKPQHHPLLGARLHECTQS